MADILKSAQAQADDGAPPELNLPFSSRAEPHADVPLEPLPIPVVPPPLTKKRGNTFLLLAVLLFLFATIPLAVFFISQQSQLADLRGRAQVPGPYPTCKSPNVCVPSAAECRDGGGKQVSLTCPSGKIGTCCNFGTANTPTPTPTPAVTCICDICNLAGSTGPGTCSNGVKQAARPGCAASASQCSTTNPTPTPTPGAGTNQCQNGEQNRDQGYWLICECANGCSYKTDTTPGSGGSGWVCDQNCRRVPIGTRPSGTCTQIDWVHNGTSDYCGVAEINCPASCQTDVIVPTATPGGNPTPTPTPPPASTPTPTPIPGETCEVIKVYDAENTDITLKIKDGTRKLALGEQIILATSIGSATAARFRIQGIADWTENNPDETTETEYRLTITIPTTLTQAQGTFEAEVFVDGQWK